MAEQAYAYVTLIPVAKGFQREIAKELAGIPAIGSKQGMSAGATFKQGFKDALDQGPSLGKVVGGVLTAAVVGGGALMTTALNAASAFYAEFEGVNQIFLEGADSVQRFAETAAQSIGVSETEALRSAKAFGAFATSAGLSGQAAADFSVDLLKAAGDLASFNDVPVEQALQALQSGLAGQTEPLRNFQIFIDDTTLKAYAMEQGLGDVYDSMDQNEKTILRQAAIMDQLGVRQGDFVNYADTFGNAIKTIQATFQDLGTEIGLALMPSIEALVVTFRDSLGQIQDPTTSLGESWAELIGTFEAFGDTFATVFGRIDAAAVLEGILDVVQMLVNGMSQLIYVGGDVADILSKIFTGDFEGAWKSASSFFTRYNSFVDGLYQKADDNVNKALGDRLNRQQKELADAMRGTATITTPLAGLTGRAGGIGGATGPTQAELREQVRGYMADAKEAIADARKEYQKLVDEAREDYADTLADIESDYADNVAKANDAYIKRVADITKRYNNAVAEATKRRDESLATALQDYNAAVADINADFAQRQADIIQQSMSRLTDAFRSVVATNVADIFDSDQIAGSIDGTIEMMREKLMASRQLMANAAALSAAGFSQTFIEQVVSAGTDVGNEMATAILNATPEQRAEMQALFGEIENTANNGMDDLAQSLYEKNGLATQELRELYAQTEQELADTLLRQKEMYDQEVIRIETEFTESIAEAQRVMNEALVQAQAELDEALVNAEARRQDAILQADEDLRDALVRANERFLEDIERIEEVFNDRIEKMKGKVGGLTREIGNLQSALDRISGEISTRTATLQLTPFAEGGLVTGPTAALIGEAGPEVVIPLDRFESMMNMNQGAGLNYYAAPNQSLDSEQALFDAMRRAKVVVGW